MIFNFILWNQLKSQKNYEKRREKEWNIRINLIAGIRYKEIIQIQKVQQKLAHAKNAYNVLTNRQQKQQNSFLQCNANQDQLYRIYNYQYLRSKQSLICLAIYDSISCFYMASFAIFIAYSTISCCISTTFIFYTKFYGFYRIAVIFIDLLLGLINYLYLKLKIVFSISYIQLSKLKQLQNKSEMSSSPYISNEIKQYMRKYEIENLINTSINELLRSKPEDPYGFLIGTLQKLASSDIKIVSIKAYQIVSGEGFPVIKLQAVVNYLNKNIEFVLNESFGMLSEEGVLYDVDRFNGKGLSKCVQNINSTIAPKITGYKCNAQTQIDKVLQAIFQQKGGNWLHIINTMSYSIPKIQSHILNQPLYKIIAELTDNKDRKPPTNNLNLVVNCLHGGKAIGSKCKVFKYMIISKNGSKDPYLAQSILLAVRKSIVSGKGGEASLKFAPDGTFVCPVDTIMDNLKIVEQAINSTNAKDSFGIGLSWAADTLYSPDTKKYESQNPKTPFDNDQMIDYLIKLVTDKPIITYLEDPLAASQLPAWKKLKTKLESVEALKQVKLGTRNQKLIPGTTYPFSQQSIKKSIDTLSVLATVDSHPQLTPQQLTQTNQNKISLDFYTIRLFELKTLSNAIKLSKILQKTNTTLILQDNLYETYDSSNIDACYAIGGYICMSTINNGKFDRVAKLNRIKQISILNSEHK